MAKRFTDTDKWKDEWWGSLPNDYRMIWLYLIDSCSIAGIWKKDFRGLNFNCNTNIDEKQFLEIFGTRLIDRGNFFFIPKFLRFQCPKGLNSNKPAILSIVKEIEQNNLTQTIIESLGNDFLIIKGKDKGKGTGKDKGKEEGKDKEVQEDLPETSYQRLVTEIGEKNGHQISIKPTYLGEQPIIIHDLQEYFRTTNQLDAITRSGWIKFSEFMKHNPAAVFNSKDHLYNAYRNFNTKPDHHAKFNKPATNSAAIIGHKTYAGKL
jgi:hypothetical protein